MKKVFSNHSECAHVWAQRTQSEGRANNIFFENDIIYSYGYHFELAKFIDYKGKIYLFVNTGNYSNSTRKHQNHVRKSINNTMADKIFYFDFSISNTYSTRSTYSFRLDSHSVISTVERLFIEAKNSFNSQLKATANSYKVNEGLSALNTARGLLDTFHNLLEGTKLIELSNVFYDLEPLKQSAIIKANHLQATREQREQARKQAKADKEQLNLSKWLKGTYNEPLYNLPIYLRLQGDYIQTSHGAKVPKLEALKAFKRIKQGQNIVGEKIGLFTVNEQHDNLIIIGCHHIDLNNVETFLNNLI
jgi:hypothetical protein